MTQKQIILDHLKKNGSITPLEALGDYGVYRLSDVILKLRRLGYDIVTEDVTVTGRTGKKVTFAKYVLGGAYVE